METNGTAGGGRRAATWMGLLLLGLALAGCGGNQGGYFYGSAGGGYSVDRGGRVQTP